MPQSGLNMGENAKFGVNHFFECRCLVRLREKVLISFSSIFEFLSKIHHLYSESIKSGYLFFFKSGSDR